MNENIEKLIKIQGILNKNKFHFTVAFNPLIWYFIIVKLNGGILCLITR